MMGDTKSSSMTPFRQIAYIDDAIWTNQFGHFASTSLFVWKDFVYWTVWFEEGEDFESPDEQQNDEKYLGLVNIIIEVLMPPLRKCLNPRQGTSS